MSAEAIRKQIFAADDAVEETIEVEEWGVKLLLLSPSAKRRAAMIDTFTTVTFGADGEALTSMDVQAMIPSLVIACAFDPDTREPVFTEADREGLSAKNGMVVERVGKACLGIAGLTKGAVDAGKDDSSTTPSDGTGSVLPGSLAALSAS